MRSQESCVNPFGLFFSGTPFFDSFTSSCIDKFLCRISDQFSGFLEAVAQSIEYGKPWIHDRLTVHPRKRQSKTDQKRFPFPLIPPRTPQNAQKIARNQSFLEKKITENARKCAKIHKDKQNFCTSLVRKGTLRDVTTPTYSNRERPHSEKRDGAVG